jgi:hypothetical protein
MGRGRAKAKQTKVARRLKYTTTGTDLDRLREELTSGGTAPADLPETDDFAASYDDEADDDDEDDEAEPADRTG